MSSARTQRIRDPVHGLIAFRDEPVDTLAWQLINTPEFQRLRRIKQLGVSEFVFPSATHSRFAHCIGVFHTARQLVRIIERETKGTHRSYDPERAAVAVIAALLHDLGHGPFSHTFESMQKARGFKKRHETWTAEIIKSPDGGIRRLLDTHRKGFCDEVADLLEAEDPADIYHAVVSSSFDADRLDYLRRDRLMTGTGAGAIDFDLLMEHLRISEIETDTADNLEHSDDTKVATFCLDPKALPAAEQFLLSRYTLHEQVYFHKTTRCIEQMLGKLMRRVADLAQTPPVADSIGLPDDHPLVCFFGADGQTLVHYLALDDQVVAGAIEQMRNADDGELRDLAERLRHRLLYKPLDLSAFGYDQGKQAQNARRIDKDFVEELKRGSVIKDEGAAVSVYTPIGGDDERAHKRLHILDRAKGPVEISSISKIVEALREQKKFTRYYFQHEADRNSALNKRRDTP